MSAPRFEDGSDAATLLGEVAALLGCFAHERPSGEAIQWLGLAPVVWLAMHLAIWSVRSLRRALLGALTLTLTLRVYIAAKGAR